MNKKKRSHQWWQTQTKDHYVRSRDQQGWRSRAVFKLAEVAEIAPQLHQSKVILELGSAPGGWTQWLRQNLAHAHILAIDRCSQMPIERVDFLQNDFLEAAELGLITAWLAEHHASRFDWILSDMAPNLCGIQEVDASNWQQMIHSVMMQLPAWLKLSGSFLYKGFHGAGFQPIHQKLQQLFAKVQIVKPKASKKASKEIYLLASGYTYGDRPVKIDSINSVRNELNEN